MSLPSALSRSVGRTQRLRGEAYFRQNRVRILGFNDAGIRAQVRGTRSYGVALHVDDDVLRCECTCPFFLDNILPCKHVWATLVAAWQVGSPRNLGQLAGLEPVFPDDVEVLSDEEPEDAPWSSRRPDGAQRDGPGNRPGRRPVVWRESIALIQSARRPERSEIREFAQGLREVVYLIDLDAIFERGRLILQLLRRDLLRGGSWGKPGPLSLTLDQAIHLPDPVDRRVLSLLYGARFETRSYLHDYERLPSLVEIPAPAADLLMREICSSRRCLVRRNPQSDAVPLLHEGGEPWRFLVEVRTDEKNRRYLATGVLARGAETLPLAQPDLLLDAGLFFAGDRVHRLDHGGLFSLIVLLRRLGRIEVPRTQGLRFVSEILAAGLDRCISLPPELGFEETRVSLKPAIRIRRPAAGWRRESLAAVVSFDYDGHAIDAGEPPGPMFDLVARRLIPRDQPAESAAIALLHSLGFRTSRQRSAGGTTGFELAPSRLPAVVPGLLGAGWRVEADGKLYRTASTFNLAVSSGIDWFELRGGASYDGLEVPLPELLAALKKGTPTVLLDDGTLGVLPGEWLARYAPVAGLGEGRGDHVRFARSQAGFLDALIASAPEATCDAQFEKARLELRKFDGVAPLEAPQDFRGTLRPYQKEGLGWLSFLRRFGFGGCLADDMGLGKTVQVLALLQMRHQKGAPGSGLTSLVVAPRSVVFNWADEARRFTPRLRVLDHTGLVRTRSKDELAGWDVLLTTYGTLRRDIAILKEIDFDTVVLDEAQAIKNAGTQTSKVVRLLRGEQRLALSGTPIENHIGELWSLFEFLNPGMLGSSSAFQAGARGARTDGELEPRDGALLGRALRPFILRRTKSQVAPELPDKTEQTLTCTLEGDQRRLYEQLLEHYRASLLPRVRQVGIGRSSIQVLEALLRLRQAACHPGLLDPKRAAENSAKFDILLSQLDEVVSEGHKALIFSQFTSLLALLKQRLDARGHSYSYLDGSMGAPQRKEAVRRFQDEADCPLFLLSLKAGGFGLNLTAAEYVYLLDPWWNPAVEAQAIDRTHRIGQTRAVFAYRIVAAGTIEDKILALQSSKRKLADSILAADATTLGNLTREDLELLFS